MRKSFILIILVILVSAVSWGQTKKKALFLGNSYTGANNLPQLVAAVANSMGDTLITGTNAPGGYTLQGHSTNTTSLNDIRLGYWDFVVLQEQSQRPSFPTMQVQTEVFPYAHFLDSMINAYNDCCETVFYMTWGRKNGDATNCSSSWPAVCTYQGMDSLLYQRYMTMTYDNHAVVSPVGAAWHYIRQNYPAIELYETDESHPSTAGSYAAACCFYTIMFRKDPSTSNFNYSITAANAANIRAAVKRVVFDSLMKWQVGKYDTKADFSFSSLTREISFNNLSVNTGNFSWDFGDNATSTVINPVHTYAADGNYMVRLAAYGDCNDSQSITKQIIINTADSVQQSDIRFYPNPVSDYLYIDLPVTKIQRISVINSLGQKLGPDYYSDGNKTRIDLRMLSAGTYFVSIISEGKIYTKKIIKK